MSSYGYNVISYSLLRTLRFVHVVVSLHNVTPDYTFSFIFENLLTFLFLFSFRLVKVAKRETEIRGRGGEGGIFWGGKRRDSLTLTFIMSSTVFNTMRPMIKYSKGVDTTILQILYFTLFRSFGMYLSRGRACIVKSMQDF